MNSTICNLPLPKKVPLCSFTNLITGEYWVEPSRYAQLRYYGYVDESLMRIWKNTTYRELRKNATHQVRRRTRK